MAVSRTMWARGLKIDLAKMETAARIDRAERTKEITAKWREGFKVIKEENDFLQKRNADNYEDDISAAKGWYQEQLAKGPPMD